MYFSLRKDISGISGMVVHSQLLLSKCAQFREKDEFIDVRLNVGEDVFSAHRVMFLQAEDVIELKDESILFQQLPWTPSTVEVLMSTIKTFLKFVLQPITFMLLVLFNAVEFTRKPSLRSVRSGAPNVNFRKSICSADDTGGGRRRFEI